MFAPYECLVVWQCMYGISYLVNIALSNSGCLPGQEWFVAALSAKFSSDAAVFTVTVALFPSSPFFLTLLCSFLHRSLSVAPYRSSP